MNTRVAKFRVEVRPLHQRMNGSAKLVGEQMRLDAEQDDPCRGRCNLSHFRGEWLLILAVPADDHAMAGQNGAGF